MKLLRPAAALGAATCLLATLLPAAAAPVSLNLDRVLLSNGGVAYFEYRSSVQGDATLELPIRLDQVDDVLKSLVVLDDGGSVTGVSLPGREPLAQRFRELPFSPADLATPTRLLNALRGEQVEIARPRRLKGRLLSVEEVKEVLADKLGVVIRHRVSVVGEQGLQQVELESADALQFSDPVLQQQVEEALLAIALYRNQDNRTLTIDTRAPSGDPQPREVRAGYVASAPLWKASYRMLLSAGSDQARLQGWAHLENLSGQDWKDISLTLASGNPVTFRQALYQAYFVDRPSVPVEVLGRVLPKMDSGALTEAASAPARKRAIGYSRAIEAASPAALSVGAGQYAMGLADGVDAAPPPAPGMAEVMTAGASEDVAEQVLFTLPQKLSLANGHALMTPIVDREVPAERLSLYQPSTHAEYPLDSVRVENDGETGLPPGVMTLYGSRDAAQGAGSSFLGDARMDGLPAADTRLLSFALDRKVRVKQQHGRQRAITGGRISNGLFYLQRRERMLTEYRINPLADRLLWLEHPVHPGWDLTEPRDALIETTRDQYRLAFKLSAGQPRTVQVAEERPIEERLVLNSLAPRQIAAFVATDQLSPALRRVFERIGELRQAMIDAEQAVKTHQAAIDRIHKDQQRLRENMRNLNQRSDLYQRYVGKLGEQESRLEATQDKLLAAERAVETRRAALNDYISGIEL